MDANDKKNTRIFYLTLAVILTTVAIIVIAITVARRNEPMESTRVDSSIKTQEEDINTSLEDTKNKLPSFVSPMKKCSIDVDFSDTVLVFSSTMGDYRTHEAIDLTSEPGQEVVSVADGIIKNVWQDHFMGTCVAIEHTGNAVSYYKSLDPVLKEGIEIGATIKAGDVIGTIGESAANEVAQDPHLHFELKVNDKHVDPKEHIKFPAPEVQENIPNK